MSLRPYQQQALEQTRAHVTAGKRAPLVVMPTGTGKTRLAAEICRLHQDLGGSPLFVAPRRELVTQARGALTARGLTDPRVHTIQELTAAGADVPASTLVVLDEARHYVSDAWSRLRDALPSALFVGLDATPGRGDGRGLGGMFDVIVEAITTADAIKQGYLVPFEILRPARALESNELAQDPVAAFLARGEGSGVVFARSVELAQSYALELRISGVTAACVWGAMPDAERDHVLSEYAAGRIRVLTNAALLCEGWDAPITETIVLARGFGTEGGYIQALGRGARLHPGKTRCLVLDLRGVSHLHGEPEETRTWHLEGKACRRAGDNPDIRFCQVCGSVLMVSDVACPECGREGTHRLRPPRVLGLPLERFAALRRADDDERARRLARWLGEARSKGWREGQAMHRYKGAFGEFPPAHVIRAARTGATR